LIKDNGDGLHLERMSACNRMVECQRLFGAASRSTQLWTSRSCCAVWPTLSMMHFLESAFGNGVVYAKPARSALVARPVRAVNNHDAGTDDVDTDDCAISPLGRGVGRHARQV
jgi:hypothetical protein